MICIAYNWDYKPLLLNLYAEVAPEFISALKKPPAHSTLILLLGWELNSSSSIGMLEVQEPMDCSSGSYNLLGEVSTRVPSRESGKQIVFSCFPKLLYDSVVVQ